MMQTMIYNIAVETAGFEVKADQTRFLCSNADIHPMEHIRCPCIWPVDANTYSTWSTGPVAVTDIGFPGAHMEPIHSLQQELGRRMKNAGIQVLDGIDATNGPMLQQLMPNAGVVIWVRLTVIISEKWKFANTWLPVKITPASS